MDGSRRRREDPPPATTTGELVAGLRGMENLGNTCYMNCAIQCLAVTKPIYRYIRQKEAIRLIGSGHNRLAQEFIRLLNDIWEPRKMASKRSVTDFNGIQPTSLKKELDNTLPQFKGYDQHDAQEFLASLLDVIFENSRLPPSEMKNRIKSSTPPTDIDSKLVGQRGEESLWKEAWHRYRSQFDTTLVKSLQGFVMTRIQCCHCYELSLKFEPTTILSVPIVKPETGESISTLSEALELYFKPEILTGGNRWSCPSCKTLRTAEKTTEWKRYPKILMVHLKRFTFDGRFRKLNHYVSVNHDATAFVETLNGGAVAYKLYAVINHTGRYTDGHYSAYCLHPDSRDWFQLDDDSIRRVSDPEREVISESSYVLFFKQQVAPAAEEVPTSTRLWPGGGACSLGGGGGGFSSGMEESAETLGEEDRKKTDEHEPPPSLVVRHNNNSSSISASSSSPRRRSTSSGKTPLYLSIGPPS